MGERVAEGDGTLRRFGCGQDFLSAVFSADPLTGYWWRSDEAVRLPVEVQPSCVPDRGDGGLRHRFRRLPSSGQPSHLSTCWAWARVHAVDDGLARFVLPSGSMKDRNAFGTEPAVA